MWVAKFKIKHDCLISNRCRKFKCTSTSIPLNNWFDKGYWYTMHTHTLSGEKKNISKFFKDLRKDKEVLKMEVLKNTIYVTSRKKTQDQISANYNQKMFFVKPIHVDLNGVEHCEFGAFHKETLMKAINTIKQQKNAKVTITQFNNTKLETVHFPKVLPKLSEKQAQAFELALKEGYYKYPRNINLQQLAKIMKQSPSTFQEHLRKAEAKMFPSLSK